MKLTNSLEQFLAEWRNDSDKVLVHTSGSTSKPKPMWAEKQRMLSSARITCDFLGLKEGDTALLCLSTDYIAGKMMVVRSLERNLRLHEVEPSNHPLAALPMAVDANTMSPQPAAWDLVAMVPSQVYCSLQVPEERQRLMDIKNLIIGGGAISKELEHELQSFPNAVWSTYGMTETLSHIALRRLNGPEAEEWYTPFDGVDVSLNEENCLVINAPSVHEGLLTTNDIAELRPASDGSKHCFRIIGRKDNVICSGGVKLHIEELETMLSDIIGETQQSWAITKRPDPKFGEAAVLLTSEKHYKTFTQLLSKAEPRSYNLPTNTRKLTYIKDIICVPEIPLTRTGKIDRKASMEIAATS